MRCKASRSLRATSPGAQRRSAKSVNQNTLTLKCSLRAKLAAVLRVQLSLLVWAQGQHRARAQVRKRRLTLQKPFSRSGRALVLWAGVSQMLEKLSAAAWLVAGFGALRQVRAWRTVAAWKSARVGRGRDCSSEVSRAALWLLLCVMALRLLFHGRAASLERLPKTSCLMLLSSVCSDLAKALTTCRRNLMLGVRRVKSRKPLQRC